MSSVAELRADADLTSAYFVGPSGNQTQHFLDAFDNAYAKYEKGFPIAAADILGQLFRQYLAPSISGNRKQYVGYAKICHKSRFYKFQN